MDEFENFLNNLFSIPKEPNQMMISNLYKHFQQKDSKFYLIDFIVHLILFMRIPQKEKLGFIFDALLLFYHKTTIGKNFVI